MLVHGHADLLHEELAFANLVDAVVVAVHQAPKLIQLPDLHTTLEASETGKKYFEVTNLCLLNELGCLFAAHSSFTRERPAKVTSVTTHSNLRRDTVVNLCIR